jgi:hypothetical protein
MAGGITISGRKISHNATGRSEPEGTLVMKILFAENVYLIRKGILGLAFGACAFMFSCNGSETTWTAESRSPDGKIIATARSVENSGFGTGGGGTTVFLNWTTGSQPATEIFDHI